MDDLMLDMISASLSLTFLVIAAGIHVSVTHRARLPLLSLFIHADEAYVFSRNRGGWRRPSGIPRKSLVYYDYLAYFFFFLSVAFVVEGAIDIFPEISKRQIMYLLLDKITPSLRDPDVMSRVILFAMSSAATSSVLAWFVVFFLRRYKILVVKKVHQEVHMPTSQGERPESTRWIIDEEELKRTIDEFFDAPPEQQEKRRREYQRDFNRRWGLPEDTPLISENEPGSLAEFLQEESSEE